MKEVSYSQMSQQLSNLNDNEGREFGYILNDKRAKAKLLKGAKRSNNLEIDRSQGCVNLRFNDGSYFEVVLPLLRLWNQKHDKVVTIEDTEVRILEINTGVENTKKHIDTKLIVMAGDDRIVIHAYNGTQNVMVQGKNYERFALECLEPFFRKQIECSLDKIDNFNKNVKELLGPSKTIKRNDKVCPQCGTKSKSNCELKIHMKTCHSKPSINSPPKVKAIRLLNEDMSLLDETDTKEIDMEDNLDINTVVNVPTKEISNVNTENINKINIEASSEIIEIHDDSNQIDDSPHQDNSYEYNCNNCEVGFENETEYGKHMSTIHVESQIFKCVTCDCILDTKTELVQHMKAIHDKQQMSEYTEGNNERKNYVNVEEHTNTSHTNNQSSHCNVCDFDTYYTDVMKEHIEACHVSTDNLENQDKNIIQGMHLGVNTDSNVHQEEEHEQKLICDECGYFFTNLETLSIHVQSNHGPSLATFPCNSCDLVLAN